MADKKKGSGWIVVLVLVLVGAALAGLAYMVTGAGSTTTKKKPTTTDIVVGALETVDAAKEALAGGLKTASDSWTKLEDWVTDEWNSSSVDLSGANIWQE